MKTIGENVTNETELTLKSLLSNYKKYYGNINIKKF